MFPGVGMDNGTAAAAPNATTTAPFAVDVHWPLYTVLPAASIFFYASYFLLTPLLLTRCASAQVRRRYAAFGRVQQMCFRANLGSAVHSYGVVVLMIIVISSDDEMRVNRMHPHYNAVGYGAMCLTLGYFSLSVPWSAWLCFYEKRRDAVPLPMMFHHVMVVCGALVYVLGGVCALYGAIGFACMELTNLFFIPRVLFELLLWPVDTPLCTINGVLLVATFVLCRVGVCTAAAVLFTQDLVDFRSDHAAEWLFVIIAYVIFLAVLVLSWIWLRRVLNECREGVQELLAQRRAVQDQKGKLREIASQEKATTPGLRPQEAADDAEAAGTPRAHQPSPASITASPNVPAPFYCASRGDDQDERAVSKGIDASLPEASPRGAAPAPPKQLPLCAPPVSRKVQLNPLSHAPAGTGRLRTPRGARGSARVAPSQSPSDGAASPIEPGLNLTAAAPI